MDNGTPKRAAIYCRVSTPGQEAEGTSLQTQDEACRKYAAEHGYTVDEQQAYREVHTGTELWERPELTRLREAVRRKTVDIVVAFAIDRLARDPVHLGVIISEAEYAKVDVLFVTEPLDNSPEGQLIRYVRGYAAKVEHEKIRERGMRGKLAKARSGKMLGVGPTVKYVYQWRYEAAGAAGGKPRRVGLDMNPETAPIVRRAFQEVTGGKPLNQIVRDLMADGIRAPGGGDLWRRHAITAMVRDPIYTGKAVAFRYQKIPLPDKTRQRSPKGGKTVVMRPEEEQILLPVGTVPALVDEVTQQVALKRLAYNQQTASRHCAHPENFLLRAGFIFCGYCGGAMIVETRENCGSRYRCHGSALVPTCQERPTILSKRIDDIVWQKVKRRLGEPDSIPAELAKMATGEAVTGDLIAVERALAKNEQRRRNLATNLALLDAGSAGPVREQLAAATEERKRLEVEREGILGREAALKAMQSQLADLTRWCREVAAALESLNYEERRTALAALGVRVTVWRPEHEPAYEITATIPLGHSTVNVTSAG